MPGLLILFIHTWKIIWYHGDGQTVLSLEGQKHDRDILRCVCSHPHCLLAPKHHTSAVETLWETALAVLQEAMPSQASSPIARRGTSAGDACSHLRAQMAPLSFCSAQGGPGMLIWQKTALTFGNQLLQLLVESLPVAFPPEPHVGRVVLSVALVDCAHSEDLPPVSCQEEFPFPAVQPRPAGPERQVVVGVINEARIVSLSGDALAPLSVLPGISFVPMVRADRHGQHAQGTQS